MYLNYFSSHAILLWWSCVFKRRSPADQVGNRSWVSVPVSYSMQVNRIQDQPGSMWTEYQLHILILRINHYWLQHGYCWIGLMRCNSCFGVGSSELAINVVVLILQRTSSIQLTNYQLAHYVISRVQESKSNEEGGSSSKLNIVILLAIYLLQTGTKVLLVACNTLVTRCKL